MQSTPGNLPSFANKDVRIPPPLASMALEKKVNVDPSLSSNLFARETLPSGSNPPVPNPSYSRSIFGAAIDSESHRQQANLLINSIDRRVVQVETQNESDPSFRGGGSIFGLKNVPKIFQNSNDTPTLINHPSIQSNTQPSLAPALQPAISSSNPQLPKTRKASVRNLTTSDQKEKKAVFETPGPETKATTNFFHSSGLMSNPIISKAITELPGQAIKLPKPPVALVTPPSSLFAQQGLFNQNSQRLYPQPMFPGSFSRSRSRRRFQQKARPAFGEASQEEPAESKNPVVPSDIKVDPGDSSDVAEVIDRNYLQRGNFAIFRLSPFAAKVYGKALGVMLLVKSTDISELESHRISEEYREIQAKFENQGAYLSRNEALIKAIQA